MLKASDAEVIEAIRRGNRRVLAELYCEMLPLITSLAATAGLGPDDARDVFQDAVVVVFEKSRQPDFELTSKFSTFFYGICRNIIGNRLRKRSNRHVTIDDNVKYIGADDKDMQLLLEDVERHRLFYRAFRQLGTDCQRLLELSFEHVAPSVIMTTLGIKSNDYFRRRKYLCKEKLVQLAQNDPEFQELRF